MGKKKNKKTLKRKIKKSEALKKKQIDLKLKCKYAERVCNIKWKQNEWKDFTIFGPWSLLWEAEFSMMNNDFPPGAL